MCFIDRPADINIPEKHANFHVGLVARDMSCHSCSERPPSKDHNLIRKEKIRAERSQSETGENCRHRM